MMLGLGLSAVCLWPAITTQHLVFLDRMTTGYFAYKNWLFFSNFSLWRNDKLPVLLLMIDLAGIACCAFVLSPKLNNILRRLNTFWLAVVAAGLLMMTELSTPIWRIFPL